MDKEPIIRLSIFFFCLLLLGLVERLFPRRHQTQTSSIRWGRHLTLIIASSFLIKIVVPFSGIVSAEYAMSHQWGLFNWIKLPTVLHIVLGIVILDFLIYAQHVLFHKVPLLWRLHRMHHSDTQFDVTTGFRFHPLEIILSMYIKISAVMLLGISAWSILLFEILLNASSLFNHSNLNLSKKWDVFLRRFVVTPDMHRVHHSVYHRETDSNYGFLLSIWDRLFSTYVAQPKDGHLSMRIGLSEYREHQQQTLGALLKQPFTRTKKRK